MRGECGFSMHAAAAAAPPQLHTAAAAVVHYSVLLLMEHYSCIAATSTLRFCSPAHVDLGFLLQERTPGPENHRITASITSVTEEQTRWEGEGRPRRRRKPAFVHFCSQFTADRASVSGSESQTSAAPPGKIRLCFF